ncbi:hypothetical protein [Endozoicomonas sp. GU-1]|uniref:hypothetical protein n=1 Tax=Endozoicomonas sp. GU-1 TaxID=3009078 RepID=UPI0022B39184|nr:hypothetical protein [Endozoicomonas sp. GU-1]WBA86533.1 hypothetical protein O3276_00280 [Endozoicomonas sp. GU-1]
MDEYCFYSKSAKGFFDSNLYAPEDSVKITAQERSELLASESSGLVLHIEFDNRGVTTPIEPIITKDELKEIEWRWRNYELGLTDRVFTRDFGPNEWSEADRDTAQNTIMAHRRNLKDWSEKTHPEFPNSEHRPVWPESVPRPAV